MGMSGSLTPELSPAQAESHTTPQSRKAYRARAGLTWVGSGKAGHDRAA